MRRKWLIAIPVVLVLVILLVLRLKGTDDKKNPSDKTSEDQTEQIDANSAANAGGEEDEQLGTLTANESGGMDITVTAEDGTTKT